MVVLLIVMWLKLHVVYLLVFSSLLRGLSVLSSELTNELDRDRATNHS